MLFKSINDFKEYEAASSGLAFDKIKPYIKKVEQFILVPAISKAQYKDLDDAYNASVTPDLSDEQKELLDLSREAIAPLALAMFSKVGQVNISSAGFQITSTDTMKNAFPWQMAEVREECRSRGYAQLDLLLQTMDESNGYALWKASTAYTTFKEHVIQTAAEFDEYYSIRGSRYMFQLLRPFIKKAEEGPIKKALLPTLYASLKAQIKNNSLTDPNKALIELLKPAVAGFAFARGLQFISVSITENGITVFNNESSQTVETHVAAGLPTVKELRELAEVEANSALDAAEKYILENLSDFDDYTSDPLYKPGTRTEIPHFTSDNGKTAFL